MKGFETRGSRVAVTCWGLPKQEYQSLRRDNNSTNCISFRVPGKDNFYCTQWNGGPSRLPVGINGLLVSKR